MAPHEDRRYSYQRSLLPPQAWPSQTQTTRNYHDCRNYLFSRFGTEERLEVVNDHTRLLVLEIDLMIDKAHKSALLVITEWTTLLAQLKQFTSRHAERTVQVIIESLTRIPKALIKTVTLDNDKAFHSHWEKNSMLI